MIEFFDFVLIFIVDNLGLVGLICFFVVMGEVFFLIGLFVFMMVVFVGVGIFVGFGKLDLFLLFVWILFGVIVGDVIFYWIGWKFKDKIKSMWLFNKYMSVIESGEDFFWWYGGKSVFIGWFVLGVKLVVFGIVGMVGMNFICFIIVNVMLVVVWSVVYIVFGVIVGLVLNVIG